MPNNHQNGTMEMVKPSPPISQFPNSDIAFDDLIERQPGWLLRSGILLLLGTVALFVALASFIKYPDKLSVPFVLTTENPPIDVVALAGGQIAEWYVADGQKVGKGQKLAYLDNPAELGDVEKFAIFVEEVANNTRTADHLNTAAPENLQMGEMRQTYTTYLQALASFQNLLRQRIVFEKMGALNKNAQKHGQLGQAMERQLLLFEKELALAEKDFRRNQQLNREGIVSDLDFEKNEAQFLQKQQQLENLKSALIQNKIEIAQLNTQVLELKSDRSGSVNEYLVRLDELSRQFRNEHRQWEEKYIVESPISGTVSIMPGMVEKRTVKPGEALAGIVPEDTGGGIVAHLSPMTASFGKIEKGNRVLLRLDAYPYKEFGVVQVEIGHVSLLPEEGAEGTMTYEVLCPVPEPMMTTTDKPLGFRQKLTGTAQVITKDRSIAQRLVERVLAVGE